LAIGLLLEDDREQMKWRNGDLRWNRLSGDVPGKLPSDNQAGK
jgi:hypothetical protein